MNKVVKKVTVREMYQQLDLSCPISLEEEQLKRDITGGIVSDLLSNVMGRAKSGAVWVTMQAHQNIIAVASLADLSAVIVAGGVRIEAETLAKAQQEKILLFATPLSAYEVVGKLYQLGIGDNA